MKTLRDYQLDGVKAISTCMRDGSIPNPVCEIPTGGGKALMIADITKRCVKAGKRVINLTHSKELVAQNYEEFAEYWGDPLVPAGIYSAGLRRRDLHDPVLFAGIQSVWSRAEEIGRCDYGIVDEAHMVPKKGQGRYRTFIDAMRKINPDFRMIGFSATPYRLSGGLLYKGEGALFDGLGYRKDVRELIDAGYLSPLVSKSPDAKIDVSKVRMVNGEFHAGEMEQASIEVTEAAVAEVLAKAAMTGRSRMMFFSSGVAHANLIHELLKAAGLKSAVIVGTTPTAERDHLIAEAKACRLDALVSMGVLTTGFNWPQIDLLALLRATNSTSLYVQMVGRGMRIADGKKDCLVMDFGENIERHGPINALRVKQDPANSSKKSEPVCKVCPVCKSYELMGVRFCTNCGHEWAFAKREVTHHSRASQADIIDDTPDVQELPVDLHDCNMHTSASSGKLSLKVTYDSGMLSFHEYWSFQGSEWSKRKAANRWVQCGGKCPPPSTVDEAYRRYEVEIKEPSTVVVERDGRRWNVKTTKYA